jgi:hypothetical protein
MRPELIDFPTRRRFLADASIDAYARWREECRAVEAAYERWVDAEPRARRTAFLAYGAALDQEEAAARVYEARTKTRR